MDSRTLARAIWWYLRWVLLLEAVIVAGTGLVCWLAGWRTAETYGSALVVVGLVVLVLGFIGFTSIGELSREADVNTWFPRGYDTPVGAGAERVVLGLAGLAALVLGGLVASLG